MTRPSRALAVAAGLWLGTSAPAAEATMAYLYADASEGGGGGGHAALVLGDRVFHFEHRAPGVLQLAREAFEDVKRRYSVQDNRTLLLHEIAVSEETHGLILDEFTRRYFVQQQHLDDQRALAGDRRLLELALARRLGAPGDALVLEAAGLFFERAIVPGSPTDSGAIGARAPPPIPAPALEALREVVAETHGDDFVARAMARIRAELDQLTPEPGPEPLPALSADRLVARSSGFAQRYRDHVLALLALDVLAEARPLRPGSVIEAGPLGPDLEVEDAEMVERLLARLQSSLVRLLDSRRPDWGLPLLVGMARLIALDETRRTGRWVVLDSWPADAPVISRERLLGDPTLAPHLAERARADFESVRGRLRAGGLEPEGFPESDVARLESALSRAVEVADAVRERRDVRVGAGLRAPARGARHPDPALSALDTDAVRRALAVARAREAAHTAAVERLYAYDLFTRNCVTEIFRTIEAALAREILEREPGLAGPALDTRIEAAEIERLGGYVDPGTALNFIPAMAAASVRERLAVSQIIEIPSYRRSALHQMYERQGPLQVFLRESNTLTSTLYRKGNGDSAFLFFTDDVVATRPVFGALNLLTGLGMAAAGLVMLPVDHGATLRSGLAGALWSLPELAFFNIRKGSFPDADRSAPAAGE